jgi:putative hydrolase of the HAD superfamily
MIKAVIFDLDDTLYSEADYCASGLRTVAEHLAQGFPQVSTNKAFKVFWQIFRTGDRSKIFNAGLEKLDIEPAQPLITELIQLYRNHKPAITLDNQTRTLLTDLAEKYKLGLITDGYLPAQKLKVQALNIVNLFEQIIYTEELGREFWKPSPKSFELMAQYLNTKTENMVYVADNLKKDFLSPNKLGYITIRMARKDTVHEKIDVAPKAAPQYNINQILELRELLAKL